MFMSQLIVVFILGIFPCDTVPKKWRPVFHEVPLDNRPAIHPRTVVLVGVFESMSKPKIIIFSDHPAANSGLARITRDLATRLYKDGEFDVATLGYGAAGSSKLPFPQYQWNQRWDFLPVELPQVAQDFCGDEPFILLTIGDVQRFLPLADVKFAQDQGFAKWWHNSRKMGKAKLWGYFPIDAHSIGGKLGPQLGHTLSCYDRILVPSQWAAEIVKKTLPHAKVDVLPHGIDTDVFKPYPKEESRDQLSNLLAPAIKWPQDPISISDDALWIGIVATNQARKDWGLGIEVVAELNKTRAVFLWAHTDRLKNDQGWGMTELLSDFGLLHCSMLTAGMSVMR